MATLVIRPPVTVGHTLTEPANSYDILHFQYTVTLPSVYISRGHSYTFSATISVQSPYAGRPKELYNFCGIVCMGRNPHSLAERAAVHPTSIISLQVQMPDGWLDAGRLPRSQNPEGPASGHLDPNFHGFPGS